MAEEHVLFCRAQVVKGQRLGRESFWKPLPVLLPLFICALPPPYLLAAEMLPLPYWRKVTLPGPVPAPFRPHWLLSACQVPASSGRALQAALLFLESRPLDRRGWLHAPWLLAAGAFQLT